MDKTPILERLDKAATDKVKLFRILRELPVDLVGDILLGVPNDYPRAGMALPRMPGEEVQVNWTGAHGRPLLLQSCAFVRALENGYFRYAGATLDGKTILDYGCGWGRLVRLMYKFTAPENIYACDPWKDSIELCTVNGVQANLALCDYVPKDTPFPGKQFDLIYAFSVFTHLSERTCGAVLLACRKAIAEMGILVITVRPASYWDAHDGTRVPFDRDRMKSDHATRGYAFTPHNREPVDGDICYGDASISLDYVRANWVDWELLGVDWCIQDPYQVLAFLRPRTGLHR